MMTERQSTADRFAYVMAEIRTITDGIDNDHPHRYPIRCMQQTAEKLLHDAIDNANRIADLMRVLKQELEKK